MIRDHGRPPSFSFRRLRRRHAVSIQQLVVASVLVVCAVVVAGCDKASPEDKVRARIKEGVTALEAQDLGKALDLVDDSYRDETGRTKEQLKFLMLAVTRQGPLSVVIRDEVIALEGDKATATFTAFVVQGSGNTGALTDALPSNARQFSLVVNFIDGGDGYRVTSIAGLNARRAVAP